MRLEERRHSSLNDSQPNYTRYPAWLAVPRYLKSRIKNASFFLPLDFPAITQSVRNTRGGISHITHCTSLFSLCLCHSTSSLTCAHKETHTRAYTPISLYCKGSSKLLVVGPHLSRADGCFSAPHGQHSGDEGSSLRRKRLSICFSNCSSSSSSHIFFSFLIYLFIFLPAVSSYSSLPRPHYLYMHPLQ